MSPRAVALSPHHVAPRTLKFESFYCNNQNSSLSAKMENSMQMSRGVLTLGSQRVVGSS